MALGTVEHELGHSGTARALFEEAVSVARANSDNAPLSECLFRFAAFEAYQRDFERFRELNDEAVALAREAGDYASAILYEYNQAWVLRLMGHPEEAQEHILLSIPEHLRINEPEMLVAVAEEYAAVLADLGDHAAALRLLGAADAMRERLGSPRLPKAQADMAEPIAKTRTTLTDQDWEAAYQAGRNTAVENALAEAHAAFTATS